MGKERLIRIVLLGLGVFLVLTLIKTLVERQEEQPLVSGTPSLPKFSMENFQSSEVLGQILGKKSVTDQDGEGNLSLAEPAKDIEEKSQDLVESIRKLPENIRETIKKQIMKEICREICEE